MSRNYYSGWVNGPIWRRMMELAHKDKTPVKFNEPPGIYRVPVGEATLPGVTVAMMDPRYRRSATEVVPEAVPEGPKYAETTFDPGTQDANTVVVDLDRTTGRIATEFTPPENVVQRRVDIRQLPGYAPAADPAPLPDQQPDPAALKQVKPQAPLPVAPATQKPAQKPAQP